MNYLNISTPIATNCYNRLNISTPLVLGMVKQPKGELAGLGIDFDGDILFSKELSPKLPSLEDEIANLSLEPDEGVKEDLEE